MTQYGMAIDLKRCFGCQACATACKMANNLPKGMSFNVVYTKSDDDYSHPGTAVARGALINDTPGGQFPQCTMSFFPVSCQHCTSPSCAAVCPTGATAKGDDGIVTIDYEVCIGCGSCVEACPYDVRPIIEDDPEYHLAMAVGEIAAPPHRIATAEKCTLCKNRIDRGEEPACMQLCPGRARSWGDLDDPDSAPNRAAEGRTVMRYLESEGTGPNVLYLM